MIIFETSDKLGRKIKFTSERKLHIQLRHAEIEEFELFKETLESPAAIKASFYEESVLIYYKEINSKGYKFLAVVIKVLNGDGFILTAYKTNYVKEGRLLWKKD